MRRYWAFFQVCVSCTFALSPMSAAAGPVLDAVVSNDIAALEAFLADGADPDEPGVATPLYFAAQRGHLEVAGLLISHGAEVNNLSKWGAPLHIAARKGYEEIVVLLLKNGADPNLRGW